MKTTIWTKADYSDHTLEGLERGRARCIFNGDLPHLFRAGDHIVILEGYAVATIDHVYYNIPNQTQEIGIVSVDRAHEYPTVPYE